MTDALDIPNGPRVSERMLAEFLRVVPRGIDNAITADKLCWRLGICPRGTVPNDNHKRIIRAMRQASRTAGTVVIGSNDGYFVPQSLAEVDAGQARRWSQVETNVKDLRAEREAAMLMLAGTPGEQMGILAEVNPAEVAQPVRQAATHPRTEATPGTLAAIREVYGAAPQIAPHPTQAEPQVVRRAPPPPMRTA